MNGPLPTGPAENASASPPASSLGTTDANGVASTLRKVLSARWRSNSIVVGSMTLMPDAASDVQASTSDAPTMLPKNPPPTGDGYGLSFWSRARLIEYAMSSVVIARRTLPSDFTKLTLSWILNVWVFPSAEIVCIAVARSATRFDAQSESN